MIFHTFNISDPPNAVQFNLYPVNENETFEVYVLLDRLPTPVDNTWNYTIPRNFTDVALPADITDEELQEMRFTFVLPAANLSVGVLYFGVRTYGKEHYIT